MSFGFRKRVTTNERYTGNRSVTNAGTTTEVLTTTEIIIRNSIKTLSLRNNKAIGSRKENFLDLKIKTLRLVIGINQKGIGVR